MPTAVLTTLKDWEVIAMSGYEDVRDVGQAVTLQEKKDDDDDDDDDAIIMGFYVNSGCKKYDADVE